MRRFVKFLHTMGAIGLMGSMACLLVLLNSTPKVGSAPIEYARLRIVMGEVTQWVYMPSLLAMLVGGLLAIAFNPVYQSAGWSLAKLAMGVIFFEYGFLAVLGPMQQEAALAAKLLAGQGNPADLGLRMTAERNSLWVLLILATVNVGLGIWRPRLRSRTTRT